METVGARGESRRLSREGEGRGSAEELVTGVSEEGEVMGISSYEEGGEEGTGAGREEALVAMGGVVVGLEGDAVMCGTRLGLSARSGHAASPSSNVGDTALSLEGLMSPFIFFLVARGGRGKTFGKPAFGRLFCFCCWLTLESWLLADSFC